jgi:hypothetical protein
MSFFSKLFGLPPESEIARLAREVEELRSRCLALAPATSPTLSALVLEEACAACDVVLGSRLGLPVHRLIVSLLQAEPFASCRPPAGAEPPTLAAEVAYKERLRLAKRHLEDTERFIDKWGNVVAGVLVGLIEEFPPQAFVDPDAEGNFEEYLALAPTAPLYSFAEDLPGLLTRLIGTFFGNGLVEGGLFAALRASFAARLDLASGGKADAEWVLPTEKRGCTNVELVDLYLSGTPFHALLTLPVPLHIPEAVRFEHTHIVAGTGHGKTQALQFLIASDLRNAYFDNRSVVIMDGQGDLFRQVVLYLELHHDKVRDRFIYIDPTDIERPVGINLFDPGPGLEKLDPIEREQRENASVEFFEYFFGGLLGAELTQRQGLIFRYLAILMFRIPGANVHTLRELMEDGEKFRPYMETLTGSARLFFETRFFERTFAETKKQIATRLWGVLANASLDRMLSARKSTVDLYAALQRGSTIFINTARDFLGAEGSAIFSRMHVALLGQALARRASLPSHKRNPTYIYIDEAESVVDLTLTRMLSQVRKWKGAITFAHQNLDQLEPAMRAGVLANTSIRLAGGLSAKDAQALAGDFRCDADFLLAQKKRKQSTSFACFAKNVTPAALSVSIPLGYLENEAQASVQMAFELVQASRARYGAPVEVGTFKGSRKVAERRGPQDGGSKKGEKPEELSLAPLEAAEPVIPPAAELEGVPLTELPPPAEAAAAPVSGELALPLPSSPLPLPAPSLLPSSAGSGKGGVKHRYLQALVKELGEARGFLAVLEDPVHEGTGQVDVTLTRGTLRLAFEVSVTTTRDHELGNVEKCLALPFAHVVMLSSQVRHLKGLATHIGGALSEGDRKRVSFLLPDELPAFLDGLQPAGAQMERQVKGYAVRSKVREGDPLEAVARRRAVARVVGEAQKPTSFN